MAKVYLKFNRLQDASYICLQHWIQIFKNDEIVIIQDRWKDKNYPEEFSNILVNKNILVINSNRTYSAEYTPFITKGSKVNNANANFTCFFNSRETDDEYFWVIDADDTMFLHIDYSYVRDKLKTAEDYFINNNLDGFSLNFYREFNNVWTFGVALCKTNIDLDLLKTIPENNHVRSRHLDNFFDYKRLHNEYKLENFVFDKIPFQHLDNNIPGMNNGVYWWEDNKLWNTPLHPEVIIL
jgi:hypothetical protein